MWPASSPDLSPLDFSLWAQLRPLLFSNPRPVGEDAWKSRIIESIKQLSGNQEYINKCIMSVWRRCQECYINNGGHFEMGMKRKREEEIDIQDNVESDDEIGGGSDECDEFDSGDGLVLESE